MNLKEFSSNKKGWVNLRLAEFFREYLCDIFWPLESQLVSANLLYATKRRQMVDAPPAPPVFLLFWAYKIQHRKLPSISPTFLSERTFPWILLASSTPRIEQFHLIVFPAVLGPRSLLSQLTFPPHFRQKGQSSEIKVRQEAACPVPKALMNEVVFCLLLMPPCL